ncbi:hypothetical protein DFH08DRAFT_814786 [Mycena albidolilacea]|uniref:Uncharacterized protein n=1 Tax=Mycena albidolilacea TaxID=1033008 RepID=A0AAD7EJN8_9AGAR|nr:hypothetical protein DFH08DRAFT_814786 [Mycena albidolilacea]
MTLEMAGSQGLIECSTELMRGGVSFSTEGGRELETKMGFSAKIAVGNLATNLRDGAAGSQDPHSSELNIEEKDHPYISHLTSLKVCCFRGLKYGVGFKDGGKRTFKRFTIAKLPGFRAAFRSFTHVLCTFLLLRLVERVTSSEEEIIDLTDEDNRRILWKIDLNILSLIAWVSTKRQWTDFFPHWPGTSDILASDVGLLGGKTSCPRGDFVTLTQN